MTRILQLGKFYPIHGGVEKVMMIFTEGLDERGYSCDMLCASHDGEVDDLPEQAFFNIGGIEDLERRAAELNA